jgi:hypothetical protein
MFLLFLCQKAATAIAAFGFDSSHLHPDRVLNLLSKCDNTPISANPEITSSASEYKFSTDPSLTGRPPHKLGPLAKKGGGNALEVQLA